MEIDDYLEVLPVETQRFIDAIETTGFDVLVPTCPGWNVRDLTVHLGGAHRWAHAVVSRRATSGRDVAMTIGEESAPAGDDALVGWLSAGLDDLVAAVRETPPDTDFWRFMRDAPNSVTFWARRQAHETAIHRVDADIAAGVASPAFPAGVAADGLDELLVGFGGRMRNPIEPERRLFVDAVDAGRRWIVELGASGVSARAAASSDPAPDVDVTLAGSADGLYRLLWNRADAAGAGIAVSGDEAALTEWHAAVVV
jgi:uncharacterized protein (TIGR03083 family)